MDQKRDAREYLERADWESMTDHGNKAIVFWTRAIRLDKDNIDHYFERAKKLHRQKKYEEATRFYKRIINMDSENEMACYYFAFALDMLGRPDESIEMYKKMISLNPVNADGYYNLGILFTQKGNYGEAQKHYTKVLELQPSDAYLVSNCKGYSYFLQGESEKAIEEFQKSITLNEKYTLAYCNMNIALFCEKKFEEAEKFFEEGMKTFEEDHHAKAKRIEGIIADYTNEKNRLEGKLDYEEILDEENNSVLRTMVNGLANIINLLTQQQQEK